MNYREKIRKSIECPRLNDTTRYGEWGALRLDQRIYIKRLLDELDSADNCVKKLYLENKQLKSILVELEETIKNKIKGFKEGKDYFIDEKDMYELDNLIQKLKENESK